jgi:hypothetical protein
MGQIFSQLTKTGVYDPNSGNVKFGSPQQIPGMLSASAASGAQPASADLDSSGVSFNQPTSPNPQVIKPSPQQAAQMGATPGGVNALSPALTKGGKLATLLMSGLQGALAGRAKSEETVAATGGRRSGGAGMGFEAGYTLPWQRAQELAQTQVAQQQAAPVPTPYGALPGWLAKTAYPSIIRGESAQQVQGMKGLSAQQIQAMKGQTAEDVAAKQTRFKAVPNVGLYDTETHTVVPGTQQGITVTPEIVQDYNLPPEFLGKPMTLAGLSSLEGAQARQTVPVQGAAGPALVNKKTGKTQSLGLGSPGVAAAQAKPLQVAANPENPGDITYAPAGQAMSQGLAAPGSAATQTAKATARAIAPGGKVGEEVNAFSTAIQHADLLRSAVSALNNGDEQTLNSLKNRFKTEFGVAGPITAQAIADAYQREVVGMLSKGHMTDSEVGSVGKTLSVGRQSPEQTLGVIDAYRALAQSKMNVRQQGVQQGMRGKANFPQQNTPQGQSSGRRVIDLTQ